MRLNKGESGGIILRAERSTSIDVLKGLGIIAVVIGHAMNTDNYYSNSVELIRRFVYLYHLSVFFFCSGYLLKAKPVKSILLRFLKQYWIFVLICLSSFAFLPLWVKTGIVALDGYQDILNKISNIVCFKQDGYFVGAMWFMPFMATTSVFYSILLLIEKQYEKVYYLLVILCAGLGIYFVTHKGLGRYYVWVALLMIPIMAAGREYRKRESRVPFNRITLLLVAIVMLILCTQGEIELSKGIIYGRILFYPITLLGLLFCIKLKNSIMKNKRLSDFLSWIGSNSMYVMGYHFIVFKLIDTISSAFISTTPELLKLFPYSFPQCRVLYICFGVLLPCTVRYMLNKAKNYIKDIDRK